MAICRSYGDLVEKSIGKAWYARKYDYPYLGDVVMDFGCAVDVAETATSWSNVENLYQKVKAASYQALKECTEAVVQNKISQLG